MVPNSIMVFFFFFCFRPEIVSLSWNFVSRLIRICRIQWWCSFYPWKYPFWNKFGPKYQNYQFKVSEYPFKQNKNMLKNITVLLYTYFYNISLNVLRPTFFSICNLPFLHSPNIGKIRVKVGPKTNYFSHILSSCTNRLQFSIIFFHWYVANQ